MSNADRDIRDLRRSIDKLEHTLKRHIEINERLNRNTVVLIQMLEEERGQCPQRPTKTEPS